MNAWADSWGVAWSHSWDFGQTPAPVETPQTFGTAPFFQELRPFEERDPYRHQFRIPRKALEIIEAVAERQVDTHLDEIQRFDELRAELEAQSIEFEARYLEALNELRDLYQVAEIKSLLAKKNDEEAMLLILIAAYLT